MYSCFRGPPAPIFRVEEFLCPKDGGSKSSKIVVCIYQTTWYHIPQDRNLQIILCPTYMLHQYIRDSKCISTVRRITAYVEVSGSDMLTCTFL